MKASMFSRAAMLAIALAMVFAAVASAAGPVLRVTGLTCSTVTARVDRNGAGKYPAGTQVHVNLDYWTSGGVHVTSHPEVLTMNYQSSTASYFSGSWDPIQPPTRAGDPVKVTWAYVYQTSLPASNTPYTKWIGPCN